MNLNQLIDLYRNSSKFTVNVLDLFYIDVQMCYDFEKMRFVIEKYDISRNIVNKDFRDFCEKNEYNKDVILNFLNVSCTNTIDIFDPNKRNDDLGFVEDINCLDCLKGFGKNNKSQRDIIIRFLNINCKKNIDCKTYCKEDCSKCFGLSGIKKEPIDDIFNYLIINSKEYYNSKKILLNLVREIRQYSLDHKITMEKSIKQIMLDT